MKTGTTKPTAPYKESEGLPLKYWLYSYLREVRKFHPNGKCVLCDKVENTILLRCTCIIGTPTCEPCCEKSLLDRGKLYNLHRDELLKRMNSSVGGPVVPLPHMAKTQPNLKKRERAQAWSNPENENLNDFIKTAMNNYRDGKSETK